MAGDSLGLKMSQERLRSLSPATLRTTIRRTFNASEVTTRKMEDIFGNVKRYAWKFNKTLLNIFLYVSDSITYSCNLLSLIVGNRDFENLLKFHDELYGVEGVSAKVVSKVCFRLYLIGLNAELVNDDLLYFLCNFRHSCLLN